MNTTNLPLRLDLRPGDRIRIIPGGGALSSRLTPLVKGIDLEVTFVGQPLGGYSTVEGTPLTTKGNHRTRDGVLAHRSVELTAGAYTVLARVSRTAVDPTEGPR